MTFDPTRYDVLVESVSEGVAVYDAAGQIVRINDHALALLGLRRDQFRGRDAVAAEMSAYTIDGEPLELDDLPVPTTLRTREPREMVVGIARTGAPFAWLSVRSAPLDEGGAVATFHDAAELRQARLLDRAVFELATHALETTVDGFDAMLTRSLGIIGTAVGADRVVLVTIDHEAGRAVASHDWSAAGVPIERRGGVPLDLMATLLGRLTRRERVVVERREDVPGDAAIPQTFLELWQLDAAAAAPLTVEGRLHGFVVLGWAAPRTVPDRVVGFAFVVAGLLASLVARGRADAELRELNEYLDDRVRARSSELARQQERTAALIAALPDLLFELDGAGVFETVHAPDDAFLLVPAEELIGRSIAEVLPPALAAEVADALALVQRTGVLEVLEYTLPVEGIDHVFECRLVPRGDGGALAVIRDVTGQAAAARAQREQAARLAKANEELERAVAARDGFLASVGHELRTPLGAVLGLTELLLDPAGDPLTAHQRAALETLDLSGRHLLGLINDLLEVGRAGAEIPIELATVVAGAVARDAVEVIRPIAEPRGLRVELVDAANGARLEADEQRLRQVLVNLLDNAVKFTDPGGSLGVQVWLPGPDEVAFAVWDTGIGIAPEDHGRIFEPLVQVDGSLGRRHAGSGLGLALAHQLVARHGGHIELESELGHGARFVVTLPREAPGTLSPT